MDVVYAITTTSVNAPNGVPLYVTAGSHWPATDPIVRAYPWLFSADPHTHLSSTTPPPPEVEQATAAPGEKRQVRR